ncbi:hypothetical protein [uncultured Massilia sp.]|uniref:hypothetical protein n=1 Tax=uncultured Massilia sp. TaxID=169973 RepID=UPI0025F4C7C8|nr:hypothetical protein [uncultured Massilia sp.]
MNSAFTNHRAGTKAGRLANAARRAALACVLVLGAGAAFAQQGGDRRDNGNMPPQGMQEGPRPGRFYLPPQDRDQRQMEQRAMEERRQQEQNERREGRGGRMTPDERRDLRRQINEAGMDLYQRRR